MEKSPSKPMAKLMPIWVALDLNTDFDSVADAGHFTWMREVRKGSKWKARETRYLTPLVKIKERAAQAVFSYSKVDLLYQFKSLDCGYIYSHFVLRNQTDSVDCLISIWACILIYILFWWPRLPLGNGEPCIVSLFGPSGVVSILSCQLTKSGCNSQAL